MDLPPGQAAPGCFYIFIEHLAVEHPTFKRDLEESHRNRIKEALADLHVHNERDKVSCRG